MTDSGFKVIGDALPKQAMASKQIIDTNVTKAKATPGQWCTIHNYRTINGASNAKTRCATRYPDLEWAAQTIDGQPQLVARFPSPTQEPA